MLIPSRRTSSGWDLNDIRQPGQAAHCYATRRRRPTRSKSGLVREARPVPWPTPDERTASFLAIEVPRERLSERGEAVDLQPAGMADDVLAINLENTRPAEAPEGPPSALSFQSLSVRGSQAKWRSSSRASIRLISEAVSSKSKTFRFWWLLSG